MARPSEFTQEVADAICERLSEGESLRAICASEGMPGKATVFRWLAANAVFRDQYARAREEQADTLADEILAIADEPPELAMAEYRGEATVTVDGAAVQHQRLRIDARKWVASKLKPKKYSDKIDLAHTGPDGGPVEVVTRFKLADLA